MALKRSLKGLTNRFLKDIRKAFATKFYGNFGPLKSTHAILDKINSRIETMDGWGVVTFTEGALT